MARERTEEITQLPQERLGTLIRVMRKVHRFSMRQLAEESGVSHSYIALLEAGGIDPRSGRGINPQPNILKRIGDKLSGSYLILMAAAGYLPDNFTLTDDSLFTKPDLVVVSRVRERVEKELGQNILEFVGRKTSNPPLDYD